MGGGDWLNPDYDAMSDEELRKLLREGIEQAEKNAQEDPER